MIERYGINENDWMLQRQDDGHLVSYNDWLRVRTLLKNLEVAANEYYHMADISVSVNNADPECVYENNLLAARNEARGFIKETKDADEQKGIST